MFAFNKFIVYLFIPCVMSCSNNIDVANNQYVDLNDSYCNSSEYISGAVSLFDSLKYNEEKILKEYIKECADKGQPLSLWYELSFDLADLINKELSFSERNKLELQVIKKFDYLVIKKYTPVWYYIISITIDQNNNGHKLSRGFRKTLIYKCLMNIESNSFEIESLDIPLMTESYLKCKEENI